jgi:hypothetical protein
MSISEPKEQFKPKGLQLKHIFYTIGLLKLIGWTQQNAINVFDSSKLQKPEKGFIPPAIDEDGIDHRTETLSKLDTQD